MMPSAWLVVLAVLPFALLAWSYVGYPAVLWLLTRARGDRRAAPATPRTWPTVSVLVAAYNEERVIRARLENLLALDYPEGRLEVLVGSDGSTDGTAEIVRAFASRGVRLVDFPRRRGKASVVNDLAALARGEVLVLSDANSSFDAGAVRELVRALWTYPRPAAAVGRLTLVAPAASANLDGLYWRYESWIKGVESRFGTVLGANGAIYAVRRAHYVPLPAGAIVDDFLLPMLIRRRWGGPIVLVPAARAREASPASVRDEFRRRVRIGSGDLQTLRWTWTFLLPGAGIVAVAFVSHKLIRWLGPWLLVAGFAGTAALAAEPGFRVFLGAQLAGYVVAASAPALRGIPAVGRVASAARYFMLINIALMLGSIRLALGRARPFWATTTRDDDATDHAGGPPAADRAAA